MLILASASPRRRELLSLITNNFQVLAPDVDETLPEGIAPVAAVKELARRKAAAVSQEHPEDVVIGADTLVVINHQLLGKPCDQKHAFEMLQTLSGKIHQVYTGIAIRQGEREKSFYSYAHVEFSKLSEAEIWAYIDTGEPMDKAGAYGIQEKAARFVKGIQGDYFSVIGLPVQKVYEALKEFSVGKPH